MFASQRVDSATKGTTALVSVDGEVDLASAPAVHEQIRVALRGRPETLVIDLAAVNFLDSAGVRMLVETHRRSTAMEIRLVVIRPRGPARLVMDLCHLESMMTVVDGSTGTRRSRPLRVVRRPRQRSASAARQGPGPSTGLDVGRWPA